MFRQRPSGKIQVGPAMTPKPIQVKCKTCKHYVDLEDAQLVTIEHLSGPLNEFYCPMHRVPYDIVRPYSDGRHYYKRIPARLQEVRLSGIPINESAADYFMDNSQ
jgi:hypothetical protein